MDIGLFFLFFMSAFGLTILVIEKGQDWPISIILNPIRRFLQSRDSKIDEVFDCPICFSFWASLLLEIVALLILGKFILFWPLGGLALVGFVWFVYSFLNSIDPK